VLKNNKSPATPLRHTLREDSPLLPSVRDGLQALEAGHRDYIAGDIRAAFADSLNLDDAMRAGHENENRWDYLLGHAPSNEVVALEPHSAKQEEISRVVRKLAAAKGHLQDHLRDGARIKRWLWVASGKVQFADTEKTRRLLDQKGIQFVGTVVNAKHLPPGTTPRPGEADPRPAKKRARR